MYDINEFDGPPNPDSPSFITNNYLNNKYKHIENTKNMKNNKKENKDLLEITNIKINLPNKTIELTSDEARQVAAELNKLFILEKEKKNLSDEILKEIDSKWNKIIKEKEYIPYPIYIPRDPFWNKPDPYYPWSPIIWCGTTCESTSNFQSNTNVLNFGDTDVKYNALEIDLTK